MPRRPHLSGAPLRARTRWLATLLCLTAALSGCAGHVTLVEPSPSDEVRTICTAVMAGLPKTVLDLKRRKVEPGVLTAAWGDPAISLRCGVSTPAAMTQTSQCFEVNGVGWLMEPANGGRIFTTIGRPALIEVAVPDDFAPEANALVDLAAVITASNPVEQPCL